MTPEKLQTIMEEHRLKSGLTPKTELQTPMMMQSEEKKGPIPSPTPVITPPVFASPAPEPVPKFQIPSIRRFKPPVEQRDDSKERRFQPSPLIKVPEKSKWNIRPQVPIDMVSVMLCFTHIAPILYIGCDDIYTNSMIIITMALQIITTMLKPYDLLLDKRQIDALALFQRRWTNYTLLMLFGQVAVKLWKDMDASLGWIASNGFVLTFVLGICSFGNNNFDRMTLLNRYLWYCCLLMFQILCLYHLKS